MAPTNAAELVIHAPLLIATGAVLITVDIGVVGLRIWARRLKDLGIGADDWTCVASCFLLVGMAIAIIVETAEKRFGYPEQAPPTSDAVTSEFAFYPAQILQIPALGLVKISFLLFYQRVFIKSASPFFYKLCWFLIASIAVWAIAFTFAWIFPCGTNFEAFWHSTIKRKLLCLNVTTLVDSLAITDFIFDVIVIGLPLPNIWRLQLSARKKLQLTSVFLLGIVTVAASCVRLAVFVETENVVSGPGSDLEILDTNAIYWALVEAGLAIVTACMPTLSFFFTHEGLHSVVHSARSVLSLHSSRSSSSLRSRNKLQHKPSVESHQHDVSSRNIYNANTTPYLNSTNTTVESEASHEIQEIPLETLQHVNGIVVGKKLTQSSEYAGFTGRTDC